MSDDERNPNHDFLIVHPRNPLPQYDTDPLWIQYALDSVKSEGLVFLVVQDGFLKRGSYDAQVRQFLIEKGLLVAVISLHADHAQQSQYSQLSLLVINKDTQHNPDKTVFFWYIRNLPKVHLYAEPDMTDTDNYHYDDIAPLCNLSLYPFMSEVEKQQACDVLDIERMDFVKTAAELKHHNYNLSYEFYLSHNREQDYPDLQQADMNLKQAKTRYLDALRGFEELLTS
jgi:type I restriction-modification system DNA methylase subunit